MIINEVVDSSGNVLAVPKFEFFVGQYVKAVRLPYIVVWPGVIIQNIVGPNYHQLVVTKHRDVRKIGLWTIFGDENEVFTTPDTPTEGFFSPKWPLTKVAEFELTGDLSRRRTGVQRNYDGFYCAAWADAGPDQIWYGGCFGNYTKAVSPVKPVWPYGPV